MWVSSLWHYNYIWTYCCLQAQKFISWVSNRQYGCTCLYDVYKPLHACKFNLPLGQGMCGQHVGNTSGSSRHLLHRTSRAVEVQNIYLSKLMVYKYCQVQNNLRTLHVRHLMLFLNWLLQRSLHHVGSKRKPYRQASGYSVCTILSHMLYTLT